MKLHNVGEAVLDRNELRMFPHSGQALQYNIVIPFDIDLEVVRDTLEFQRRAERALMGDRYPEQSVFDS